MSFLSSTDLSINHNIIILQATIYQRTSNDLDPSVEGQVKVALDMSFLSSTDLSINHNIIILQATIYQRISNNLDLRVEGQVRVFPYGNLEPSLEVWNILSHSCMEIYYLTSIYILY